MAANGHYLVTAQEMREMDRHAIEETGFPAMVLMENAGRAIAEEAAKLAGEWNKTSTTDRKTNGFRWLILAGKGNNGGDGLVCARHLTDLGHEAAILYAAHPDSLQAEAAQQRDIVRKLGLAELTLGTNGQDLQKIDWNQWDGIIDALLGTGSSGKPREPYASLIRAANESGLPIVSADIPSGLDADTGSVSEPCIRAALTVALAFCKRGLMQYPGAASAGKVVVRAIGMAADSPNLIGVNTYLLNKMGLSRRLGLEIPFNREQDTHKGTYGHTLIMAGSAQMSGAGLLCTRAALRGGSGLVTWMLPGQLIPMLTGLQPEAILRGLDDGGSGQWSSVQTAELLQTAKNKQAVVIGPGFGRWDGDVSWLRELLEGIGAPVVLDADALNMWADYIKETAVIPRRAGAEPEKGDAVRYLAGRKGLTIITPHPAEMARLCGLNTAEVQGDRIGISRQFSREQQVIVVLKGARTVIAAPDGDVYVNTTGNPGMATGGSGDVLAGIIGSLLAQGLEGIQAAALGVYSHGLAGDRAAAARPSNASLIAGDIIEAL
ncbi:NAD(P)H-hydrate dehydratase [Paenibacillus nasutitermitis]|uniref:Bifunctional NAD(P)H-hydrate repair enzyme n=1 Tax=Paenibacillus nasutitermitis TaxID=1652958 RepID=A0A917DPF7_9BACL|nr:NAD(P)H-hydrate dehydratase [Paenibacillus nasutitermitis]GGD57401.1 bifunctional NAD(P)H-hydrate repair enzyme Nnr [Paenibacillus nasutitermitis]